MKKDINKTPYFKPSKREIMDLFLVALTSKGGVLEGEDITIITPTTDKKQNAKN